MSGHRRSAVEMGEQVVARASRANHQLGLGPMPLRNSEHEATSFRNSEHGEEPLSESEQIAAELFDEAVRGARLESKEIAHLCGVSVSLVDKWRSAEARGCPSLAQMLKLPVQFHFAMHRAMDRRYGFGRAALARVLDGLGDLALAIEARG